MMMKKKTAPKKNHTYKNKQPPKKIDKNMLQELYKSENTDTDLDNMGDFVPVQKPMQNINVQQVTHTPPMQFNDNPVNENAYNTLNSSRDMDMYNSYIDSYKQYMSPRPSTTLNSDNELLTKIRQYSLSSRRTKTRTKSFNHRRINFICIFRRFYYLCIRFFC